MEVLRISFEWVQALPSSAAIRESLYGYPYLLTAHVLTMAAFAGLVIMMDLRLIGIGHMRMPFSELQQRLFPWQMAAFGLSAVTGFALFYGQPMRFYGNIFFWLKTAMMLLAAINMQMFHRTTYDTVDEWDRSARTPFGARLAGLLSVFLWAGVVVSGRMIAYNWFS